MGKGTKIIKPLPEPKLGQAYPDRDPMGISWPDVMLGATIGAVAMAILGVIVWWLETCPCA